MTLDAFPLVIIEIVIITYSLTGSSKFKGLSASPPSVAAGFLCGWEPGSHWKWRSSSHENASLCSATTIPVQVHAGCVLFTAGLLCGSWSALLRIMCWILDLGQKLGSIGNAYFCSLAGRIRVRSSVWIPSFGQVLSGSVLLLQGRMSSSKRIRMQ